MAHSGSWQIPMWLLARALGPAKILFPIASGTVCRGFRPAPCHARPAAQRVRIDPLSRNDFPDLLVQCRVRTEDSTGFFHRVPYQGVARETRNETAGRAVADWGAPWSHPCDKFSGRENKR